jgi:GNAT superfamily N-acetyltransferase
VSESNLKFVRGPKPDVYFRSVAKAGDERWAIAVIALWKKYFPAMADTDRRIKEVVLVIENEKGEPVGVSTAARTHVPQLKNYLYSLRLFIDPEYRIPGLTSALLVKTRDELEERTTLEPHAETKCVGIITLVENDRILEHRREAVWPASKMVYIGNSPKGKHIRVYYFE